MSRETSTRRTFLQLSCIAATAGLAGCNVDLSAPHAMTSQSTSSSRDRSLSERRPQAAGSVYTDVYRETIPSVVLITTGQGQGTGFLYDDNHIVTNAHVVGRASSTKVRFDDGRWTSATVEGTDLHSDLAVLSVDTVPESATPLSFVQTQPVIGQEVIAIGNPYNLDGSVTSGIISGLNRLIPSPAGYQIPDAIQTDAAVNPGNSGGPLMSLDNRVLGVVNSKRGDNIAFGISGALTQRVVSALIETGEYEHAYMGVSLDTVTPAIADANDMDRPRGLLVVQTVRGGPAAGVFEQSEIETVGGQRVPVGGDVILEVDGTQIESMEDLASYLALQTSPGETIQVTVLRDGTETTVALQLAARPQGSQSPLP